MVSNPENDSLVTNSVSEQTGDYSHSRKLQHSVFANSDLISVIQASKKVQGILNITLQKPR